MKPTNVTGYPFSNGDRLTAISVNQICNALDAIQDYNDTIKEFEDLVEENTEEIKSEIGTMTETAVSAVRGMDSVSLASDVEDGKKEIAAAINAKGGSASATESFAELAEDITTMPTLTLGTCTWVEGHIPTTVVDAFDFTYLETLKSNISTVGTGQDYNSVSYRNIIISNCPSIKKVEYTQVTEIPWRYFNNCPVLEEVICPNVSVIGSDIYSSYNPFKNSPKIRDIVLGSLTSAFRLMVHSGAGSQVMANLRNITIGITAVDIMLAGWTATNVIAEGQSGIDELNTNIMNNLISNLSPNANKTITLGASLYNVLTAETLQAINDKGWNVASA